MANGYELATGYVSIVASTGGLGKDIRKQFAKAGDEAGAQFSTQAGKSAQRGSGRFKSILKTGFTAAAGGIFLTAGAVAGKAFTSGLNRHMQIENATAKLKALKMSASDIEKVMKGAEASVKGTAFGMNEAVDVAAAATASGIKPGKELDRVLKTVANTAAVAGTDMKSMGAIFNKIAAGGKLQGEELNQLADAGVPALQLLSKHLGKSAAEVRDMVSKGQIDFATFEKAMSEGLDPEAAKVMGDTLAGSWANVQAALARVGADLIGRIAPAIKKALDSIIVGLDWAKARIDPFINGIRSGFSKLGQVFQGGSGGGAISKGLESIRAAFDTVYRVASPIVTQIGTALRNQWIKLLPKLSEAFTHVKDTVGNAMQFIGAAMEKVWGVVKWVWDKIGAQVIGVAKAILSTVVGVFEGLWETVSGIFKTLAGVLTGDWSKAKDGLVQITRGLKDTLGSLFSGLRDVLVNTMTGAWNLIKGATAQAWTWIKAAFSAGANWVRGAWSASWNGIKTVIMFPIELARTLIDKAWAGVKSAFNLAVSWVRGTWSRSWAVVKSLLANPIDGARRLIDTGLAKIKSGFQTLKDGIANIWDGLKAAVKGPVDWVRVNVINPFLKAVKNILNKVGLSSLAGKITLWVDTSSATSAASSAANLVRRKDGGRIPEAFAVPGMRDNVLALSSSGVPTAWVDPGEMVMRTRATRSMDREFPGLLDAMNRYGAGFTRTRAWLDAVQRGLPAHAGGGRVKPVPYGHGGWNGGYYRSGKWHGGLDYAAPMGTPVRAADKGVVAKRAALNYSYGHHYFVAHPDGWTTVYAHLSRLVAGLNQAVTAGQIIGYSGSTGNSTGPHLHFEARKGGRQVDPTGYLAGARTVAGAGPDPAAAAADAALRAKRSALGLKGLPEGLSGSSQIVTRSELEKLLDKVVAPAFSFIERVGGGLLGRALAELPRWVYNNGIRPLAKNALKFRSGGTMPFDGPAWLSEDGRPELVQGPQRSMLRGGTTISNADATTGFIRDAVRAELVDVLAGGITVDLDNEWLWFNQLADKRDRASSRRLTMAGVLS